VRAKLRIRREHDERNETRRRGATADRAGHHGHQQHGKADVWVVDTDGDGKPDLFQFDHDGDGKVDLSIIVGTRTHRAIVDLGRGPLA
jgi:hypothetical protein